ncbi:MAG: RNA polymerase [Leifsonia sp.]|uniref:Sigma-70 family RNA polymerase sigma factor n=1 Tax=Microcella pacifica TaxID=2591847 RepID=A0A9E5MIF0_9MICO|nr:sigma-70 family RNA polymerase sigma factor [Microcella pacifica]MBR21606.1 RNA polymerase [Leifsonia sp.]NHF63620.1 sigma-70 family RNA polymerase sigma factor [Microcella pacifica]
MTTSAEIADAVTRLAREESGRVLALLTRRCGDLDAADDAVQDALITALTAWQSGIPERPAAWLYTVARNTVIDQVRRDRASRRRLHDAAPELTAHHATTDAEEEDDLIMDASSLGDERLRLLLLCCHPALDRDTQVALTLRLAGGLTAAEVAAAYLLPEATLTQRVVRAKRKIREAGMPLSIPANLDERVDALLRVLYLIFNEGYLSRGAAHVTRVDLITEAIRLTRQVVDELPASAEAEGLLALQLYHHARSATRIDGLGELVLLEHQDRTGWNLDVITEANAWLRSAMTRMSPGPYQVQAIIAGHHANARTAADTDWAAIAELYAQLGRMAPNPVVELNRAVAIAMADGSLAGLAVLDRLTGLDDYHLFHATRGELLARAGRPAAASFERALQLASNEAERRHLARRAAETATVR